MERFIGKLNKKGEGSGFRLMAEGTIILEVENNGDSKAKVIFSNCDEVTVGEVLFVAEKEKAEPKPTFEVYKEAKKY